MTDQLDEMAKAMDKNFSPEPAPSKITFDVVELQKINLQPGDVLSVKLIGDDFDVDTMASLRDSLTQVFTKNKVMIFTMPKNSDIQFSSVSETPASYCSDCSCGKKERAEAT